MKKKILLLSITSTLCLGAALAVSLSSVSKGSFSDTPSENKLINTFVIDDETTFTQDTTDNTIYYGVALSDGNNTINTKFSGFTKDGEGKLYLPKNTQAYFTNVDPINRGFSKLVVNLTNEDYMSSNYIHTMTYFSYNQLDLDEIFDGGYSDLVTTGSNNYSYQVSTTITSTDFSGILNTRYTLYLIYSPFDLYLSNISYETPCIEQVPYVEPADYTDYKPAEKAILDVGLGETMPFVGNGSYYMINNEYMGMAGIGGANMSSSFQVTLTNDFDMTYSEAMGDEYGIMFQKKAANDEVHSIMITMYINCPFMPYQIYVTKDYPYMDANSEWPSDKIEQYLSNDFANLINSYAPTLEGVSYQTIGQANEEGRFVSIIITNKESTATAICNAFYNKLRQIVAENPTYSFSGSPYDGESSYYQISIHDEMDLQQYGFNYNDGSFNVYAQESVLLDEFPLAAINTYLGVTDMDVTYPDLNAKYRFYNGYVSVYYTSKASLNSYFADLISDGYMEFYDYGGSYKHFIKSAFDSYYIYVYFDELVTKGKLTIYFDNNYVENIFQSADTFEEALEGLCDKISGSQIILNHEFPEISGEHEYRYVTADYYTPFEKGIYISGLGQAYANQITNGKAFNYYVNGYVYPDNDGAGRYLVLNSYTVNGGLFLSAKMAYPTTLLNSAEANNQLAENFEDRFGYLKTDDPDTYNALKSSVVNVPYSDYEKVYEVHDLTVVCYKQSLSDAYHTALLNNSYTYSAFQDKYHLASADVTINRVFQQNVYGAKHTRFEWDIDDTYSFVDFDTYENTSLSELEPMFANFPHEANQKSFIRMTPADATYGVIVNEEFDNDTFAINLINNGFTTDEYNEIFEKNSNGNRYLVTKSSSCYDDPYRFESDSGYFLYKFTVENNYFITSEAFFARLNASAIRSEVKSLVPTFTDESKNVHTNITTSETDSFAFLEINPSFDVEAYKDALVAKGFVYKYHDTETMPSTPFDVYSYQTTTYCVVCYVVEEFLSDSAIPGTFIYFSYVSLTYSSSLLPSNVNPLSFRGLFGNYVVEMNDSETKYINVTDNGRYLLFSFDDSVDITSYYDLLEEKGYEREGGGASNVIYALRSGDVEISVEIRRSPIGYDVRYSNYGKAEFTTSKIDDVAAFYGFTGAMLTDSPVDLVCESASCSYDGDNDVITIELFYGETYELESYLNSDSNYSNIDGEYVKNDGTYTYRVRIDWRVQITISKNS